MKLRGFCSWICFVDRIFHEPVCIGFFYLLYYLFLFFSGEELGAPNYAVPFLDPNSTAKEKLAGVNYASGGGGIMNATGRIFVSTYFCRIFNSLHFHQYSFLFDFKYLIFARKRCIHMLIYIYLISRFMYCAG